MTIQISRDPHPRDSEYAKVLDKPYIENAVAGASTERMFVQLHSNNLAPQSDGGAFLPSLQTLDPLDIGDTGMMEARLEVSVMSASPADIPAVAMIAELYEATALVASAGTVGLTLGAQPLASAAVGPVASGLVLYEGSSPAFDVRGQKGVVMALRPAAPTAEAFTLYAQMAVWGKAVASPDPIMITSGPAAASGTTLAFTGQSFTTASAVVLHDAAGAAIPNVSFTVDSDTALRMTYPSNGPIRSVKQADIVGAQNTATWDTWGSVGNLANLVTASAGFGPGGSSDGKGVSITDPNGDGHLFDGADHVSVIYTESGVSKGAVVRSYSTTQWTLSNGGKTLTLRALPLAAGCVVTEVRVSKVGTTVNGSTPLYRIATLTGLSIPVT